MVFYQSDFTWNLLWLPLPLLAMAGLICGLGYGLCALTVLARDVTNVHSAALRLLWFLSPLVTGVWLGRWANARLGREREARLAQILAVVLVALLGQLPTVGVVVYLVSFVLAVGALVTPGRRAETAAPAPVAPTIPAAAEI